MTSRALPHQDQLTVCFAHPAHRMQERFALRTTDLIAPLPATVQRLWRGQTQLKNGFV